jgi:hypothetical protein
MKNKELIIIGSVILFLAVVLTVADALQPKPVDWTPTFSARDKIPFGLYVLDAEAPELFEGDSVAKFWETPYEYFDKKYNYTNKSYNVQGTFIEISETNMLDSESVKELMYFADHGNTVMLSMKALPLELLDTLGIEERFQNILIDSVQIATADNLRDRYWFKNGRGTGYFDGLPQNDSVKVLGYQITGLRDMPNFIEAKFGNGRFLLHTQPAAFTNYYLLKDDYYNYAQKVLSFIPRGTIYWRNDYANSHLFEDPGSKLRYILSQPGLKWAWRLGLWGLVIFILFNGRRRQRVVPPIAPVKNTTLDFAKTIGNLYYQEGDHHTIIDKKIIYFLEHIRTEYLIDTSRLDEEFIQKLQIKTGKPEEDIRQAVSLIKTHRSTLGRTEKDVVAINNAIEKIRL